MANRPYQEKVDQFLADYQDKFIPSLVTGKGGGEGVANSQETTFAGMPMSKDQAGLERDKLLAASIHPDTFSKVLDVMKGDQTIPSHGVALGTPASQFSNSPEGQAAMIGQATAIPHVSTGFNPPTGAGTLQEIMASPIDFARGGNAINMTPGPTGVFEGAKPIPSGGWDWKGELANQGTFSVGPERFFAGGKEVPAGTSGAVSGDELARQRIAASGGSALPSSAIGESPISRTYYDAHPEERIMDQYTSMLRPYEKALEDITNQKRAMIQGFGLGNLRPGSKGVTARLGALGETEKALTDQMRGIHEGIFGLGKTQMETPAKMMAAEAQSRMAGVHEAAIPSESFAKYATGMHALSESERPYAFPPNSAVYQGAKLLGYVPEKPEAIHPIIRDIINKSTTVDPNTGMAGGFDIRGARQKIGFMAPWLKAQGIDVPRESYKMTKPEFMAEQKAYLARLPKKDRAKYTPQYTDQLWNEYWGKD